MKSFFKNNNDIYRINEFIKNNKNRKIVVIQNLGFVGAAMLTAVANAKDEDHSSFLYAIIGVDLPDLSGYWKIESINKGKLPIKTADNYLLKIFSKRFRPGNIMATADKASFNKGNERERIWASGQILSGIEAKSAVAITSSAKRLNLCRGYNHIYSCFKKFQRLEISTPCYF